MKKLILLLVCVVQIGILLSQERTISGTVSDETGSPVANASVTIAETKAGTVTDATGRYVLPVTTRARTLLVSYVGRNPESVPIGNNTTINVSLKPADQQVQEVVVVAYGTQKRTEVTAAISTVN